MTPDEAQALQAAYHDARVCYHASLPARMGPFPDISTRVPDPQDREAD